MGCCCLFLYCLLFFSLFSLFCFSFIPTAALYMFSRSFEISVFLVIRYDQP